MLFITLIINTKVAFAADTAALILNSVHTLVKERSKIPNLGFSSLKLIDIEALSSIESFCELVRKDLSYGDELHLVLIVRIEE